MLLVSPPSGVPTNLPPLALLYLASALRRRRHQVRLLDMDSPHSPADASGLADLVEQWRPDVLGVGICSETALAVYHLLEVLGPMPGLLKVAGGAHATALPQEPLEHGFDVVVRGEGEVTLVELVEAVAAGQGIEDIAGLALRGRDGRVVSTAERRRVEALDSLASPVEVLDLLPRPDLIGPMSTLAVVPTILSSRGCPGLCRFCANLVHGRQYRYHSPRRVLDEIESWHRATGNHLLNFCDAAFTAHRRRLLELCRAMSALSFRPSWWCEARADQLDAELAAALVGAGCTTVLVGVESGDEGVLERIGKPIPLERTVRALEQCKEAGLVTEVSIMLGFPDETVEELENTLAFMQRIAHAVDLFRPLGLVVPYPGTAIYEQFHRSCGFTGWWLDPGRSLALREVNPPEVVSGHPAAVVEAHAALEEAFLEAQPIPYSDEVTAAIRRCLGYRRQHNRRVLEGRTRHV
ncbi:MAG: radical SAM protein [Bradymonadales bacterium]|nr:radical SAM protein [Bradymonadales bacterium]